MARPCTHCQSVTHTAFNCPRRPRKPLQTRTALKPKKRMRRIGKIGKALLDQRAQFFRDNDPPYLCIYCLVIGIDHPLLPEEVNVEHGEAKRPHPELRFVKSNLYISCPYHNQEKSGRGIDEYIEYLKESMEDERSYNQDSETAGQAEARL